MLNYAPDPEPAWIPVWTYDRFEKQEPPDWWNATMAELLPPLRAPDHGPAWEPCAIFENGRIRTWKLAPDRGWIAEVDLGDGDRLVAWVPRAVEFVHLMFLSRWKEPPPPGVADYWQAFAASIERAVQRGRQGRRSTP